MKIVTISSATGRKLREYEAAGREDVEVAVARARSAFKDWRTLKVWALGIHEHKDCSSPREKS